MLVQQTTSSYSLSDTQYQALLADVRQTGVNTQFSEDYVVAWLALRGESGNAPQAGLPSLPPGTATNLSAISGWSASGAIPSPGAAIMALIGRNAAEERQLNRELVAKETEHIAEQLEEEAKEMRKKAVAQLVTGIVSGSVQIGMGVTSMTMAGKSFSDAKTSTGLQLEAKSLKADGALDAAAQLGASAKDFSAHASKLSTTANALNSVSQGTTGILNSMGQFVSSQYDVELKKMEADEERMRAKRDFLKDMTQSLTELIQKALSTADSIQQNMNQTRARILG